MRLSGGWRAGVALAVVVAGTAQAASLEQMLAQAYRDSPELAAARARFEAAVERVGQALSGFRPRLFVEGQVDAQAGQAGRADLDRAGASVALVVSQNLYAGGGTRAAVAAADEAVAAERARLLDAEQNVLLQAVRAYVATWRDRRVLELARTNQRRLARQLQATRDRFEVGEVARTDVAQAEARLARAQADVERARAELAASEAEFARVIGIQVPEELADPQLAGGLPADLEQTLAATERHPLVVAAEAEVARAERAADQAFAALLPSLDLNASLRYADDPAPATDWQRDARVELRLRVPLYQGGGEYARVREQRRRIEAARRRLDQVRREVRRRAASAWERLTASRAAVRALESEVEANRIALEGVQQEALVGARTVLDVLDAEQELFRARVDLARARADEVLASYELQAAVGGLLADRLGLDVPVYDPRAYERRQRGRWWGLE